MQPSEFWKATTWEVMRAWEGFAVSKGIKKRTEQRIPSDKARAALRARVEREAKEKAGLKPGPRRKTKGMNANG